MRYNAARWFTLIAAMFALSFAAGSAFAQDDDPPNRAARLSYASGSVSFEPAGTDEWVEAIVNRPMTTGDKLWADQDGRVEVRIDSYALRLGPHKASMRRCPSPDLQGSACCAVPFMFSPIIQTD